MSEVPHIWLEYCNSCKRSHRLKIMKCPECGVYKTPQPISEAVYENCWADYACDGCIAYRDHMR